jgi:3-oxoacyl-[acyl-carrier protein] reductase
MDLKNKKVIITGGCSGIGRQLVDTLIEECSIVGVLDINKSAFKEINKISPNVFCYECDVTNPYSVEEAVENFYNKFGSIDILVNNAGVLYSSPLVGLTLKGLKKHSYEDWTDVINTNLNSLFYVSANVVEKMLEQRVKGVIVNISSVCSAGNAGQSAYSAAKAGVNALTSTWSKELSSIGIRVVGISPGYIDTNSTRKALSDSNIENIRQEIPLKRLALTHEIIDSILFAIKNDFFNGKILEIDGGLIVS